VLCFGDFPQAARQGFSSSLFQPPLSFSTCCKSRPFSSQVSQHGRLSKGVVLFCNWPVAQGENEYLTISLHIGVRI
jgi:hypothetical protein